MLDKSSNLTAKHNGVQVPEGALYGMPVHKRRACSSGIQLTDGVTHDIQRIEVRSIELRLQPGRDGGSSLGNLSYRSHRLTVPRAHRSQRGATVGDQLLNRRLLS